MIQRKYSLSEIKLIPAQISKVSSRGEVNVCYRDNGQSSLTASPMDTVISPDNKDLFLKHSNVCLPRNSFKLKDIKVQDRTQNNLLFYSLGIKEFTEVIETFSVPFGGDYYCLLLDIANGHMSQAAQLTLKAKEKFQNGLILMVGNIANPKTMLDYAHADYIRVGIGGGSACLTSTKTGIHFPMASLVRECFEVKERFDLKTKIVADGGIATYSDIVVSLALGADYVILGKLFNKTIEAIGPKYIDSLDEKENDKVLINTEEAKKLFFGGKTVYNLYRGMSTEEVQKQWNNNAVHELKVSEGTRYFNKITYTLETFMKNYNHNLSSAMSYCGKFFLEEFVGMDDESFILVSDFAHQSIKNKPNYEE